MGLFAYTDAQHVSECSESDLLPCTSKVYISTLPIASSVTLSKPLSLCHHVETGRDISTWPVGAGESQILSTAEIGTQLTGET